jgi:hypothetical protein
MLIYLRFDRAVMGGRQNTMENSDESKGVIIIGANW